MKYVYFLQDEQTKLIKIGFAADIKHRQRVIEEKLHHETTLLGYLVGGRTEENKLHKQFAHLRQNDEWFLPAEELLEFIKSSAMKGDPREKLLAARKTKTLDIAKDSDLMKQIAESIGVQPDQVSIAYITVVYIEEGEQ